jgi:hypothetical protein
MLFVLIFVLMQTADASGTNNLMTNEAGTITASVKQTDTLTWSHYVLEKKDLLLVKDHRMLILTGVHGGKDGRIAEVDAKMYQNDMMKLAKLKEDLAKEDFDLDALNVNIDILDVGSIVQKWRDEEKSQDYYKDLLLLQKRLETAIKAKERENMDKKGSYRTLLLTYCYGQWNKILDLLRLSTLCSRMIIEKDLYELTGRLIRWSQEQEDSMRIVVLDPETRVIELKGFYGTGKTILGMEILKV